MKYEREVGEKRPVWPNVLQTLMPRSTCIGPVTLHMRGILQPVVHDIGEASRAHLFLLGDQVKRLTVTKRSIVTEMTWALEDVEDDMLRKTHKPVM